MVDLDIFFCIAELEESQWIIPGAYMPTYQFHLEGQKHGKNHDLSAQGGTVISIGNGRQYCKWAWSKIT